MESANRKRRTPLKRGLEMLLAIVIGLLLLLAVLMMFLDGIIFQPPRWRDMPEEPLLLQSDQETIAALYYPADSPVILYSHGNGEDLSTVRYKLRDFQQRGFAVIGYDYQGYGASTGKPSVKGTYRNIETVYRFLTESEKIPPEKIIVMGYSVGSGPSCWLASHFPVGGLILEAPFASIFQVVFPFANLPGDRFPNHKHIRQCQVPILIFHGEKDSVIPVRNSKKLFEAALEPKKLILIPKAGHFDIEDHLGEQYWQEIQEFSKNLKQQ